MTDPGGGYGWRSARHLPRRRGGVLGWGRIADDAELLGQDRPLCVLLLPAPLEAFELRERAEDLLTAPGVAAVDPPRLSYAAAARLGEGFADGLAVVQARRMRLPGHSARAGRLRPAPVPAGARALTRIYPDAELWYGPLRRPGLGRERALHELARERAALRFERGDGPAHAPNLPLWERMEALGIESGGSAPSAPDIG